jgi:hypothetical protein
VKDEAAQPGHGEHHQHEKDAAAENPRRLLEVPDQLACLLTDVFCD